MANLMNLKQEAAAHLQMVREQISGYMKTGIGGDADTGPLGEQFYSVEYITDDSGDFVEFLLGGGGPTYSLRFYRDRVAFYFCSSDGQSLEDVTGPWVQWLQEFLNPPFSPGVSGFWSAEFKKLYQ